VIGVKERNNGNLKHVRTLKTQPQDARGTNGIFDGDGLGRAQPLSKIGGGTKAKKAKMANVLEEADKESEGGKRKSIPQTR